MSAYHFGVWLSNQYGEHYESVKYLDRLKESIRMVWSKDKEGLRGIEVTPGTVARTRYADLEALESSVKDSLEAVLAPEVFQQVWGLLETYVIKEKETPRAGSVRFTEQETKKRKEEKSGTTRRTKKPAGQRAVQPADDQSGSALDSLL